MAIRLFDRLIQEMKFRFTKFSNQVVTLLCFIPSILCSPEINLDFHDIVEKYKNNLSNYEITGQEILLRK